MPYFYCALICIFLTGLALQSVSGVAAAHMRDCGLDPTYVGLVLSVYSLAITGFKFFLGVSYDKFGLRTTVNMCTIAALVVMICLTLITDSFMGKVFAMIYGVFAALALPLETIMLPIYAGDFLGQKSYNKILGIFVSVNTAGYAVGSPLINLIFDKFDSYNPGFIFCALLMVFVIVAMQFLISTAQRYHREDAGQNFES
jgi:MFS family permease